MPVPVVNVGVVRMAVGLGFVPVFMDMGRACLPDQVMGMLVMCVVPVGMRVQKRLVRVFMRVLLAQMQPDAKAHQRSRGPKKQVRRVRPERQ